MEEDSPTDTGESKTNVERPTVDNDQDPPAIQEGTDNSTADQSKTDYMVDKVTGKKLYTISLPVVDKTQVGNFSRSNSDPKTGRSTQLDPEREYTQTEDSMEDQLNPKEGSQIDPLVFQEMLLKNAQDEINKSQTKLRAFDYRKCWKDDDIEILLNNPTEMKNLPILDLVEYDMINAVSCQYFTIESESYKNNEGNSRHIIEKSSQKSRTIIDELMHECKECLNFTTVKFASLELTTVLPKNFYIDEKYPNCIATGIKYLLHKYDRQRLIDCGNMHVHPKYFQTCKSRKKYYEIYKVCNNHLLSSPTKGIIESFFKHIFENFDEHIDWMMENEEIKIILLINREQFLEDNALSLSSIVGGVLYSVHGTVGTCINAIGIHADYRYNSFGPLLVYLSQIFGAYHIDIICNGKLKTNFKSYLSCRNYLKDFYVSLGFQEVDDIEPFKKGGELEAFGKHMELSMWIDYEGNDKQTIMYIGELCYKMRNFITPDKFIFEDVLYDSEMWTHKHASIKVPEAWTSTVKSTISKFIESINEQPLTLVKEAMDENNKFYPARIYVEYEDNLTLPFLGKIFAECCSTYEKRNRKNRGHIIKSAIPALSGLKLRILQKQTVGGEKSDECWCQMECDRCDKVCWIKNTSLDPIVIFLLKCILSIWYQHVYTLEPTKENEWNKAFPNWHLCPKRNGMYLENLKTMTYGDEEKYKKTKSLEPYYNYVKYLEEFLTEYVNSLELMRKWSIYFMCRVWCHSIKHIKQNIGDDDEEELMNDSAGNSNLDENETKSSETDSDTSNDKNNKKGRRKRKRQKKVNKKPKDAPRKAPRNQENNNIWTDSDSDEKSDISVNDFINDSEQINSFSDSKLRQISNPQMAAKVEEFLRIRRQLNKNTDKSDCKRRSYRQSIKRHKKRIKILEKDICKYIRLKKWYRRAKRDVKIQKQIHSIEYIDVGSKESLPQASVKYLEAFDNMNDDEKIKMIEVKDNQVIDVKDKNHFVMYYGDDNQNFVVHPNWFSVEDENVVGRKVNEKTIEMCKKKKNTIQKLRKEELNTIQKSLNLDVYYHAIDRIERIKSTGEDRLIAYLDDSPQESIVNFKGYDRNSRTQYLTNEWLELNFKHLTKFWKQLNNLKVGQSIRVPTGSTNNKREWSKVSSNQFGPKVNFVQQNNNECLYYSLASAFYFLGFDGLSKMVMNEYDINSKSNRTPSIRNLVGILHNNKNQIYTKRTIRFSLKRVKYPNLMQIIDNNDKNTLYHCVMENQHSIAMVDQWIFDPILTNAVKKTMNNLKKCAEFREGDNLDNIFRYVYSYEFRSSIENQQNRLLMLGDRF